MAGPRRWPSAAGRQLVLESGPVPQTTLTLQLLLQGLPHDLGRSLTRERPQLLEQLVDPGALDVDRHSNHGF